jgi:MFS family permease
MIAADRKGELASKFSRKNLPAVAAITMLVLFFGVLSMGFQLVASRLLAPYYGSSILVWAWLISVFLLAFSIGSIMGGVITGLSDLTRRRMIGVAIAACILGFALNVFFATRLLNWLETSLQSINGGIVLSCFCLFFMPIAALSSFIPQCVALCTRHGLSAGFSSGLIYGVSTAGNILGVIITAFFLVPRFRVSTILQAWLVLACLAVMTLWPMVRSK